MEDNIWLDRYWAYEPSDDLVDIGPLLVIAPSADLLRARFGHDIEVWDAKEQDWV